MAEMVMSQLRLAQLYPQLKPYIEEYLDWVPVIRFDSNAFAAAVIPGQTEFFDAPPAIAVCNLERPNEVPYRFIILGWAWQLIYEPTAPTEPSIADALIFFEECEMEIEIDSDVKPSWPLCAVPGGGGINEYETTGAAATSHASNGIAGNDWRYFMQPLVIDPVQTFRVWLRSSGVTALSAIQKMRIALTGIEARRPQ